MSVPVGASLGSKAEAKFALFAQPGIQATSGTFPHGFHELANSFGPEQQNAQVIDFRQQQLGGTLNTLHS